MAPIRHVGLDFATGLEAALQMRSLVNMYAHFVASHIMHRIQLSLNLQQVPFDNLEPPAYEKVAIPILLSRAIRLFILSPFSE